MQANPVGQVITTGSPEMDKKLGGGLPLGSLTLVEGDSDAGKSVLSQQLTWGALGAGREVTLYTCENTTKSLLRQMDSIGLDVAHDLIMGRLRVFTMPLSGENGLSVLERLPAHIASERGQFCVVDSITPFLQGAHDPEIMAFFTTCKALCDADKTIIIILHSHSISDTLMMRLRSMSDAHLRLRIEQMGDKLVKILEVAKIRGAGKQTGNIISFNVEPGMGMRIIPMSKAKA